MPTTTTTYSFNKPVVGADEDDWGGYLNGNWDSVDDLLDGTTPVTGIDINSGTLDGVTIGGTTAGAGTFTTLTANTSITGTLATAAQTNITSVGTLTSLDVGGTVTADGLTVDGDANLSGTAINFDLDETDTTDLNTRFRQSSGQLFVQTVNDAKSLGYNRLNINHTTGDISFYEDTGTTAKFFWDASAESLGIGTSSPTFPLDVSTNSSTTNDAVVVARLSANTTGTAANNFGAALNFSGEDASGSLRDLATINGIYTNATNRSSALTFKTRENLGALTERMRIDSSGNLLVGGTSAYGNSTFTVGFDGDIKASSSSRSAIFNSTTSGYNGTLVEFRVADAPVGSIGTSSSRLAIGTSNVGAYFASGNIGPWNTSTNATRDNAIDLGNSSGRWKDLYLSGGVYLGGTGSANHLDDYEEGTWTPVPTYGTISYQQANYTKIGREVTVSAFIYNISDQSTAALLTIGGLPFTSSSSSRTVGGLMLRYSNNTSVSAPYVTASSTAIEFYSITSGNWDALQYNDLNSSAAEMYFTISYVV